MERSRPGILSVRAVNQYRRRDVLCYLGLRYCLQNLAARHDKWAREVAVDLVMTRNSSPYLQVEQFKEIERRQEIGANAKVNHRAIFVPGANEALAETALLDQCAQQSPTFDNPKNVYTYRLSKGDDRRGVFEPYIDGLRERHEDIANVCKVYPDGVVRYLDIRKFYPSISFEIAQSVWKEHCENSNLPYLFRDLGEKLLTEHKDAGKGEHGEVLTGPMFSHLIANLVLRNLDEKIAPKLSARYFRYVDDIILVGEAASVKQARDTISNGLSEVGLQLHDDTSEKNLEVPTASWLRGRNDFRDPPGALSWMTMIGDLKKYLILNPDKREEMNNAFTDEGFRIPVIDYSEAIREVTYIQKMKHWMTKKWLERQISQISIPNLVIQAKHLRQRYEHEFNELLSEMSNCVDPFDRKRLIPKLRFRGSRLIYLASEETLGKLANACGEFPELFFQENVMRSISSGEIDSILSMGTNAAQAAAQSFRASRKKACVANKEFNKLEKKALSVFSLYGVETKGVPDATYSKSELLKFARDGANENLMNSKIPFVREIACLHGLDDQPRHAEMLETAYDEDEDLALDAIDQLSQYYSV